MSRYRMDRGELDRILQGDGRTLVETAENLAKSLGRRTSTSQLRNVFTEVKNMGNRLDEETDYNLQLLRSKLAYTAGRHRNLEKLQETLDYTIKNVDDSEKLRRFKDFFEAIVAYHKKYE